MTIYWWIIGTCLASATIASWVASWPPNPEHLDVGRDYGGRASIRPFVATVFAVVAFCFAVLTGILYVLTLLWRVAASL